MKLPKWIILYIAATQSVLIAMHFLLYAAFLFFFPALRPYAAVLLISLMLLSVSFPLAWVLDAKVDNEFSRWLYIIAAVWMPVWSYILFALAAASGIYLLVPDLPLTPIAGTLVGLAIAFNVYGIVNARVIRVTKIEVNLSNLPEYWKNKTAVMASDFHLGHILRQKSAKKIVAAINKLKPDIVFIPGDVFDGIHTDFKALIESFKELTAPHGVYFCSGNHELYAGMAECEQALLDAGITILENRKINIEGLQILGTAYQMPETEKGLADVLRNLQIDQSRPNVLLKHIPNNIPIVTQAGISLQLSGHSHQGQVWPVSLITKKVWKGFDYGLKNFKALQIYTSSGVGTWGPPVRIFTKAEIVRITFI
jgi:predicted MPP superfamily phosphohydrolase